MIPRLLLLALFAALVVVYLATDPRAVDAAIIGWRG